MCDLGYQVSTGTKFEEGTKLGNHVVQPEEDTYKSDAFKLLKTKETFTYNMFESAEE